MSDELQFVEGLGKRKSRQTKVYRTLGGHSLGISGNYFEVDKIAPVRDPFVEQLRILKSFPFARFSVADSY